MAILKNGGFAASLIFLLLVSSLGSWGVEGAAQECKGGQGKYVTYANNNYGNGASGASLLQGCFDAVRNYMTSWGCQTWQVGRCWCTKDSSFIANYHTTFDEARAQLWKGTKGFTSMEAERYEGNMYLTYTCF